MSGRIVCAWCKKDMGENPGLKPMETKTLTIRLPIDLWRALKHLQADGEIESINAAVIVLLERIVPEGYRDTPEQIRAAMTGEK